MLTEITLPSLEGPDEQCMLDLVRKIEYRPKRVILLGGTAELAAHLIFEGVLHNTYKVVLVDSSEDMILLYEEEIGGYSSEILSYLETCVCDLENPADTRFAFEPDDVVVCVRILHHIDRPTRMLQRVRLAVPHGTVLIVDTTEKLFNGLIERHQANRASFRAALKEEEATEELAMHEEEWQHVDWHFTQCSIGLENVGFRDEREVKRFLAGTDLNDGTFCYAPEFPRGEDDVRGNYWFYAWRGSPLS